MTVTLSSANFTSNLDTDATVAMVLPSDVPSGASIVVILHDRSESVTADSIADPVNGTWDGAMLRQGPSNNTATTMRTWVWVFTNSAALTGGANRTITATISGVANTDWSAGWVSSDQGAMTFGAVATFLETTVTGSAYASNAVTTAGAGCVLGLFGTNNIQNDGDPVPSGSDALLANGTRSWIQGRAYSGAASESCAGATHASDTGLFNQHCLYLVEPSAGVSIPIVMHLRRMMGC